MFERKGGTVKSIEVVAAVIVSNGRVFATQRGYGEFEGGWEFPGGKVEPHENREHALVREIEEELETRVAIDSFLCTVEHDYDTFHLVMHCYICHVEEGDLHLLEQSAAKWVDADTIWSVDWLPADVSAVEALLGSGAISKDGR